MKWRALCYALLLSVPMLACQWVTNPAGRAPATPVPLADQSQTPKPGAAALATAAPAASGAAKKYQYIFGAPRNPIRLTPELDAAHSVSATVGLKGGSLRTAGADGTEYSLAIPGQALAASAVITLTPLSALKGLPFSGRAYAVQLAPEGLYFYEDAILTITPTTPIPPGKQLFISYKAGGQGVGLAAPVVKSKALQIRLMHFSGYGVVEGSAADAAAVEAQLGGDPVSAIESLAAEQAAQARENGTGEVNAEQAKAITDLINQYENEVVKPALEAAGESCKAGKDAIAKLLSLERSRQLLGMGSPQEVAAALDGLITKAAVQCVKEEYQRCVDEHHINGMIPLWLGLKREHQLLNGENAPEPEEVKLAQDLTVKCLTFELQFHSKGTFETGDGGYDSEVDGKITLHFDPATFTISGGGPLDNPSFQFRAPKDTKKSKCTVDNKMGGGDFEVKSLEYVEDTRSETDPEFYVRDFKLLYFPGVTSESYHIHCTLTDSQGKTTQEDYTSPPSGYWSGMFFTLHKDELVGAGQPGALMPVMPDMNAMQAGALPAMPAPQMPAEGGFFLDHWDLTPGDALMASQEWIKSDSGAGITETGTFKLYHKPGG